ncbi:malonyl-ACP O-methyltransferase BioC [Desulfovibrio desulfuricans]|uniref:malonyl-ACP O-methyltransferase BioC n=1 Tax=Desulfovibrio desulfuricans TaxID=876 RepID=UPI001C036D3E|nr:malonyl-ACP O-methyltransferase BioC [Desulfovibrio desulfuricans]MBT9750245.1 malonyl-ACP O-methyltransferase BioC [Desulfovibrio desulfuricans]
MSASSVRRRFSAASASYDAEAQAQRQIASHLWALAAPYILRGAAILEIGAGTGLLTQHILSAQPSSLTVNDLYTSPQVQALAQQQPDVLFCREGDAETLDFCGPFDAICSASTVQWFADIEDFLHRCARYLPKGGLLAFSSFLPGNLYEVAELTGVGLDYPDAAALQGYLEQDFELVAMEQGEITLDFASPHDVLLHLRHTGVTGIKSVGWNKRKYLEFVDGYTSRYSMGLGVRLTYRPVYVVALSKRLG